MNRRIMGWGGWGWTLAGLVLAGQLTAVEAQTRRRIAVGETKTARLAAEDWAQMWQIALPAAKTVTIELKSDAFDSYLVLRGPGLDRAVTDDDSGPECDARIVRELRGGGTYTVLVSPAQGSGLGNGEYSIAVREGAADTLDDECTWEDRDAPWTRVSTRTLPAIRTGETANGELTHSDSMYHGAPYRLYAFTARPNTRVTIDLTASFDAMLRVAGADLRAPLRNDDGGPACAARIAHTFPSGGPYIVQVTAAVQPMTGPFTLQVKEGDTPLQEDDECGGQGGGGGDEGGPDQRPSGPPADVNTLPRITVGQTIQGRLTTEDSVYSDDTFYKLYAFSPRPGATLTIDLASTDFDAYLIVRGGDLEDNLTDDDNGPGCDARVVATFRSAGPYVILVNTVRRQTGAFTLRLTEGRTAPEPTGCDQ